MTKQTHFKSNLVADEDPVIESTKKGLVVRLFCHLLFSKVLIIIIIMMKNVFRFTGSLTWKNKQTVSCQIVQFYCYT